MKKILVGIVVSSFLSGHVYGVSEVDCQEHLSVPKELTHDNVELLAESGDVSLIEKLYSIAIKCNHESMARHWVTVGAGKGLPWFVIFYSERYLESDYERIVSLLRLRRLLLTEKDEDLLVRANISLARIYDDLGYKELYREHLREAAMLDSQVARSMLIRHCEEEGDDKCIYVWARIQIESVGLQTKYHDELTSILNKYQETGRAEWDDHVMELQEKFVESRSESRGQRP